jgi:hypothetical protein
MLCTSATAISRSRPDACPACATPPERLARCHQRLAPKRSPSPSMPRHAGPQDDAARGICDQLKKLDLGGGNHPTKRPAPAPAAPPSPSPAAPAPAAAAGAAPPAGPLPSLDLAGVAQLILSGRARNIVVMAGAGISVSAGIPDFRTPGASSGSREGGLGAVVVHVRVCGSDPETSRGQSDSGIGSDGGGERRRFEAGPCGVRAARHVDGRPPPRRCHAHSRGAALGSAAAADSLPWKLLHGPQPLGPPGASAHTQSHPPSPLQMRCTRSPPFSPPPLTPLPLRCCPCVPCAAPVHLPQARGCTASCSGTACHTPRRCFPSTSFGATRSPSILLQRSVVLKWWRDGHVSV